MYMLCHLAVTKSLLALDDEILAILTSRRTEQTLEFLLLFAIT